MDNEKEKFNDDEFAFLIMYDKACKWLETFDTEKEDRRQLLDKLSAVSGFPAKSPLCLMLLAFFGGMDAGADFVTDLQEKAKGAN